MKPDPQPLHVPGFDPPIPNLENKAVAKRLKKQKSLWDIVAKQKNFLVTWTIDIEADNAIDAARQARLIQCDPESWVLYFMVKNKKTKRTKKKTSKAKI